jgi:hypothetical protein
LVLNYWDGAGEKPGVYARLLNLDGGIAGPPQHVGGDAQNYSYYQAMAAAPDGSFWVVWSQATGPLVHDLFVRHLSHELKPLSDAIQVTAFPTPRGKPTVANLASVGVAHNLVNVAFRLKRGNDQEVLLLRLNADHSDFEKGVAPQGKSAETEPASAGEDQDRYLGQVIAISSTQGQHTEPVLSCVDTGCFIAWDDEKGGAFVAYIKQDGRILWHRALPQASQRPSVLATPGGGLLTWYEDGKLKAGKLAPDGLGQASVVAKASGLQPHADIAAARVPGEWYISWRDFEAAEQEPFVARVACE